MRPLPAVFVRADANREIGWGHLVRTSALAGALRERGCRVTYLVRGSDAAAVRRLGRSFRLIRLEDELGVRVPKEAKPGSWVVLDRYGLGSREHRALREAGLRVLAVDDAGRGRFEADVVVNQNAGAERLRYRAGRGTRLLLGTRYALLRSEFRRPSPAPRAHPERARRILVTFGGSDPRGQGARICRLLGAMEGRPRVTWVSGPSARAGGPVPGVRRVRAAGALEMRRLMEACDAAVSSPSSTCWELGRLGIPVAVLGYAENQKSVQRALAREGLALDLGWHGRTDDATIARRLAAFVADARLRRRLGRRLAGRIDGKGVERVIRAMGL